MSVAVIVDTFPRWSERFIARELNELQRRGVAFSIYCLKAGDAECERDPEFSGLIARRVVLPSCFLPSFARELGMDAAMRAKLKLVQKELGPGAFRQIGCANSLAKLIRGGRHSIVYAHFASLPSTLGWLAAEALKLPLLVSVHARDVFVARQLMREKIEYARKVFVCNEAANQILRATCFRDNAFHKLTLMPHGLPLDGFPFRARTPSSSYENSLRLLAAGRLVLKKGFEVLFDALACAELRDADVHLTLLGEGPRRPALARRVREMKLGSRVSMPGVVLGVELKKHFDSADAFVMPSIETRDGDSDGLPNVLLEAFALGLPVIGTMAGSLCDVLNETTGFVVKSPEIVDGRGASPHALALAVRDVLMNSEKAAKRAETARHVVEERFDIRKNIEPLVEELTRP